MLESLLHFLHRLFNPEELQALIGQAGPPLVCVIVFVETGFFVGFFLPGDSLLITAGIVAYGVLQVSPQALLTHWLLPVMACAIVGDQVGYWIGRSAGAALYKREDSFFFRKGHLQRAHDFYEKYGGRAVILARFMPIVRTFCPPVAGAAKMPYGRYLAFDLFGGVFWVSATMVGGYLLGRSVPNIGNYIHYVIAVVVIVSILPALIGVVKSRKAGGPTGAPSSEKS